MHNNHQPKPFNIIAFLRRSQEWLEVSGYHVGDIHSIAKPVLVTVGTTVVGDIFSPQVSVAGLVCGSIVATKIDIASTGQVWGDLYTRQFDLKTGGTVQGWASSIDEETLLSLINEHQLPDERDISDPDNVPEDEHGTPLPNSRAALELMTYHQLQSEIATAKAARAEIETSFEKRLSEVAGDSSSKISSLSEHLEKARSDLTALQEALADNQEAAKSKDAQIQRQQNEMELSRNLIDERSAELKQLQILKSDLEKQLHALQQAKESVDQQLQEKVRDLETQADRLHSIETAMQDSLQHSSDLEESLLRWQELAEVTENRVQALEQDVANANFQLEEKEKVVGMLQQQKQQAEEDWQKLRAELDAAQLAADEAREEATDSPGNSKIITAATAQIVQLEEALDMLSQERSEQMLWYQTSLETSLHELEEVQAQMAGYEQEVESLKQQLAKETQTSKQWKTAVNRAKTRMEHREEKWKTWQAEAQDEIGTLKNSLHQQKQQLEASTQDLNLHISEIAKQGQRLAEAQATLAERELQLKQARTLIQQQNNTIKEIQQKTEAYIRKLKAQLQSTAG